MNKINVVNQLDLLITEGEEIFKNKYGKEGKEYLPIKIITNGFTKLYFF